MINTISTLLIQEYFTILVTSTFTLTLEPSWVSQDEFL